MSKICNTTIKLDPYKLAKLYRNVNGNREMFDWALEVEILKSVDYDAIYLHTESHITLWDKIENEINLMSLVKFCRTGKFIDE